MDLYFELVEKTLSKYPLSWQKNYFQNKKDLVVKYEETRIKNITADYMHEENIITVYGNNRESTVHELFHMSFRDKEKVGKEITKGIICGNGVGIKDIKNDRKCFNGVTEGFAQYLTNMCQPNCKDNPVVYYFIELLISIYGEDILEYSFLNDPLGFIMDKRFYNIVNFSKSLDDYYLSTQEIMVINYMRKTLEEKMKEDEVARKEIIDGIGQTINRLNEAIPRLFESIIEEFFSCNDCRLEKDLFISKLSSFLLSKDFAPIFVLDEDCVVRRKIQTSIDLIK